MQRIDCLQNSKQRLINNWRKLCSFDFGVNYSFKSELLVVVELGLDDVDKIRYHDIFGPDIDHEHDLVLSENTNTMRF